MPYCIDMPLNAFKQMLVDLLLYCIDMPLNAFKQMLVDLLLSSKWVGVLVLKIILKEAIGKVNRAGMIRANQKSLVKALDINHKSFAILNENFLLEQYNVQKG